MRFTFKEFTFCFIMGICVGLFFLSCSGHSTKKPSPDKLALLNERVTLYKELFKTVIDKDGFIETTRCDSLIFTGLSNLQANLTAAELESGRWLRRPISYPECYDEGESRSNISRDGLLGVIYFAIENKDLDMLKRLWRYGESNYWVMGKGGWQHSIYTPDHISLLAQAIYKLSNGANDYSIRLAKFPKLTPGEGFEAHLQEIFLLIRDKVYESNILADDIKNQLATLNPENPLMQVMNNDKDKAIDLLLKYWPANRLPTSADWCGSWRIEQAPTGNGLNPCPDENVTHSGGDLLFVARLINE